MGATVVVPTLLGGARLDALLGSLEDNDAQVLVVDNGGGAGAAVAGRHAGVEVLAMDGNAGFGRAVNAAAVAAEEEALVLLNDDCVAEPGFAARLAAALDPAAELVMAAGILIDGRDTSLIDSAGIEVDRTLLPFDYLNGEPLAVLEEGVADPIGPTGAAAAYSREAFLELGGFDERLFAYQEDVDLALRMRLAGARCALVSEARAVHRHSATLGSGSAAKNRMMGFGRGYLLRKYGVLGARSLPAVLARDAVICAGQAVIDRNAAGTVGRLEGFRAARRSEPDPRRMVTLLAGTSSGAGLRRRAARRARLRDDGGPARRDRRADGRSPATPAPRRTLAVFHVAEASGAAISLRERLGWLAETGELTVAVPGPGPTAREYSRFARVVELEYEALMVPTTVAALDELRDQVARFRRLIRSTRPDLAVVVSSMLPAAQLAARLEGVPVALHAAELHSAATTRSRRIAGRGVGALSGALADAVLACSRAVAEQYMGSGAAVLTVHPPIDERYAGGDGAAFRARHDVPREATLLLAVGSITEGRGQAELIDAFDVVRASHPDATLAIVGEPFPRPKDRLFAARLRERATAAGGVVRLVGFDSRVADAYAAADLFVNPASFAPESFGRAACEALVAGCPVVSTRIGAVPEILRDGRTALLTTPGDAGALAGEIRRLLEDRDLAGRLTTRGRRDVLARFAPGVGLERFRSGVAAALAAQAPA